MTVVFLIGIAIVLNVLADDGPKIEIAQPYMYHGDEFHGTSGEWWGLYGDKTTYELRKVPVVVQPAKDFYDEGDAWTGKEVVAPEVNGAQPKFLFRGVTDWVEGPVKVFSDGHPFLELGSSITLYSYNPTYRIHAFGHFDRPRSEDFTLEYNLLFSREYGTSDSFRSQVLATMDRLHGDGPPHLIWSGDLDRDRVPDFIINLGDHYNVSFPTLFLSSLAGPDELVGLAASLRTTGC